MKPTGVLVNGPRLSSSVTRKLGTSTRVRLTTTSSLFSMIASPKQNVRVVVIDVDRRARTETTHVIERKQ